MRLLGLNRIIIMKLWYNITGVLMKKKNTRDLNSLSPLYEDTAFMVIICKQKREPSLESTSAYTLILDFLASRTVRKINLCCLISSASGIFFMAVWADWDSALPMGWLEPIIEGSNTDVQILLASILPNFFHSFSTNSL